MTVDKNPVLQGIPEKQDVDAKRFMRGKQALVVGFALGEITLTQSVSCVANRRLWSDSPSVKSK